MDKLKKALKENMGGIMVMAIIVVLGVVYYWLFVSENSLAPELLSREVRTEAAELGRVLVEELWQLRELDKVDLEILNDPAISSMTDIRLRIVPEPTGRPNPFAQF